MMNSRQLYAISIIAAGLILGSGGPATASNSEKEMAPGEDVSTRIPDGVFNGIPDLNSPGGTKDAGKGSGGNTEIGTVRQGGEPDSERRDPSGSGSGKPSGTSNSSTSWSSGNKSGPGSTKADQVGQRQDAHVGDTQVDRGKEGALQNAKAITGELLRVKGDQYFLAGEDGKEVGLHVDGTTQKTGEIRAGDRIEAQADEQSHALSIRQAPTTDRRNEHSPDVLCTGKSLPKGKSDDRIDEEGCK